MTNTGPIGSDIEVRMVASGRRLRVGIAGAGWVTQHHLPAWHAERDRAEIVAIADPRQDTLEARQAAFGLGKAYPSVEAMLDAEDLDIIDICAPREAHAGLVRLGASHGLAILCQKPLAPTYSEAAALVSEIPGSVRLMVHENWRFRAPYRRIAQWLAAGDAGDVRGVELDFLSSGMLADASGTRPALVRQPFFATLERFLVSEVLIHHLDTLRFLLGEMELERAAIGRSTSAIAGEDWASLVLRTQAGAPVRIIGDFAVAGAPALPRDQLVIQGTIGTITLDGYRASLSGRVALTDESDPDLAYGDSYRRTIGHFLDGLLTGAPFETGPADNLKTLRLVEAIYEQAEFVQRQDRHS